MTAAAAGSYAWQPELLLGSADDWGVNLGGTAYDIHARGPANRIGRQWCKQYDGQERYGQAR